MDDAQAFFKTHEPQEFTDRDGKPMSLDEWSLQFADEEYRRVDETWIDGPYYTYHVSTVWLGIEGQIFETMVFSRGQADPAKMNNYQIRCSYLEEAERQHGSTLISLQQKLGIKYDD